MREMRRKKQQLSEAQCIEILNKGTSGVLCLNEDHDYPYAVPLSYVIDYPHMYFHSAKQGHKIDILQQNNQVSFCVIDQDEIHPQTYTTYFRSVIVFGTIRIINDPLEKRTAIEKLAKRYAPHNSSHCLQQEIENGWNSLCMLDLTISHMSGKEAIELVK